MKRLLVLALLLFPTPALAQDLHAGHAMEVQPAAAQVAAPSNPALPPAEETSKDALNKSPRHGEYIDVKAPDGQAIRT